MTTEPCTTTVKPGDDLRAAILALPVGGVLCFAPGTYPAPIRIEQAATLRPADPAGGAVVLDAGGKGTVFATGADGAEIVLESLTLTGGSAGEAGGAVAIEGPARVTLRGCVLRGNRGGGYGGGAIYANDGQVHIVACRITGNIAERGGGALLADGTARVTLESTLITGNEAANAGALWVRDGARVELRGTTLADNDAPAAIRADGTTTRAPELIVEGSILSHARGPLVDADKDPPRPTVRITRSVLHGTPPLLDADAHNELADPAFVGTGERPYTPRPDSPARGLWTGARGTDLHGTARHQPGTAGAVE